MTTIEELTASKPHKKHKISHKRWKVSELYLSSLQWIKVWDEKMRNSVFYGAFLTISWLKRRSIVKNYSECMGSNSAHRDAYVTRPQTQRLVCLWFWFAFSAILLECAPRAVHRKLDRACVANQNARLPRKRYGLRVRIMRIYYSLLGISNNEYLIINYSSKLFFISIRSHLGRNSQSGWLTHKWCMDFYFHALCRGSVLAWKP